MLSLDCARLGGRLRTILVVDDDASLRLLCRINLELEGYRVLEAASLRQARMLLDSETIDGALLDVHVGDGDGRAFLETLRNEGSTVPFAFFTGSAELCVAERELADAVISKPFALADLVATAAALTAHSASLT